MRKTLVAAVVGLSMAWAGVAHAATTSIWNLTGPGGLPNPAVFNDGSGNLVNVYGFTQIDIIGKVFYGTSGVKVTQTSGGLGVHNNLERGLFGREIDSDTLDNTILRDLLIFEFDTSAWSPVSISFTGVDFNDTALVYGWNGVLDLPTGIVDGNLLPYSILAYNPVFGEFSTTGTAKIGFNNPGTFKYLAVAGPEGFIRSGAFADNFRVSELQGIATIVPVPPAILLMMMGLAGIGLFGRRRRNLVSAPA